MSLQKITEFYTSSSKFRNTATFKSSVKENNDSNKTCRYVHDLSMYKNFICLSATVH